ncbi:MAG: cysteine-rich CWC family protein [Hahellaceae bacterium]|nr:cysteine-rich CWC family protein [Hahellaceae bacterium]MCP5210743.1 cysteine-rich CWC family protein [Hahellaceae bacterium]
MTPDGHQPASADKPSLANTCPGCNQPNLCAQPSQTGSTCWCFSIALSSSKKIPKESDPGRCFCASCLQKMTDQ